MALPNINPTRMELQKLKNKLRVAIKGHKLLKDKFDEMMRQFRVRIKDNKELRTEIEEHISTALKSFIISQTQLTVQQIEDALAMPAVTFNLVASQHNIMGLNVPKLVCTRTSSYKKAHNNVNFEHASKILQNEFETLIRLAEIEKTCEMLAGEIEKSRRRINALEHILIPQIRDTIKFITLKLGENERQNITRLMKVKQYYGQ